METILVIVLLCSVFISNSYAVGLSEDGKLSFLQLANKYGHTAKEYHVITEDGYILKLFHIPGETRIPVVFMHGIFDSSDTWLIRGNISLGITLANLGYDVWFGNCRGNRYGIKHLYLEPNANDGFWNFTFHQMGYYDLAAIIDTVLYKTKAKLVNAIGHSQGNAIFYVLASTRPEYNDKVNVLIALSPVCFLQNIPPPLSKIIGISPELNKLAKLLNIQDFFQEKSPLLTALRTLCPIPIIGYQKCIRDILFPIIGYDEDELEAKFVPTLVGHFPTSTSEKNLIHFSQISLRRKFARYDYGTEINLQMYNSSAPPEYDLSAVQLNVALLYGANDKLSTVDDVAILRKKLPNVIQCILIPRRKMNHADFIMGRHMDEYLYPYILDILIDEGDK